MLVRGLAQQAWPRTQASQIGALHTGQNTACAWHPALSRHSGAGECHCATCYGVFAGWLHFRHNGKIAAKVFGWHGAKYTPLAATARAHTSQPISDVPAAS